MNNIKISNCDIISIKYSSELSKEILDLFHSSTVDIEKTQDIKVINVTLDKSNEDDVSIINSINSIAPNLIEEQLTNNIITFSTDDFIKLQLTFLIRFKLLGIIIKNIPENKKSYTKRSFKYMERLFPTMIRDLQTNTPIILCITTNGDDDKKIVGGYVSYDIKIENETEYIYIKYVETNPELRRRRICPTLLTYLISLYPNINVFKLWNVGGKAACKCYTGAFKDFIIETEKNINDDCNISNSTNNNDNTYNMTFTRKTSILDNTNNRKLRNNKKNQHGGKRSKKQTKKKSNKSKKNNSILFLF